MRERNTVSASLQEFDLGGDLPKHRIQNHFPHSTPRDWAFGENGRSSRQRQTLNDTQKLGLIHDEDRAFVVGNTDPRCAALVARFVGLGGHLKKNCSGKRYGQGYFRACEIAG